MKLSLSVSKNNFSNCLLSPVLGKGRIIAFNDKYLTFASKNPGDIHLTDYSPFRNMYYNINIFSIDESNILDMEFSPFDRDILALSNDDNSIYISKIGKNYKKNSFTFTPKKFKHSGKINFIQSCC